MVDLSNREAIKRWLDTIKPAKRRREIGHALAARAMLRVVPLLGTLRGDAGGIQTLVSSTLRVAALAWVASKYPAYNLHSTPLVAGLALSDALRVFGDGQVLTSVRIVVDRIVVDPGTAVAVDKALDATFLPALPADFVRYISSVAVSAGASTLSTFSLADTADAALIDSGYSSIDLVRSLLWPNGAPAWATVVWEDLRATLLAADERWEVWTDWYEARLAGDADDPPNEALEIARATIPNKIWKQGPAVVNAEIKRLIAEHQSLQQRPAAFQFRVVEDQIDALPDDARPTHEQDSRDLYDEAKRKGDVLKDRLRCTQADENLRSHVDLLLTRLGDSSPEMRPGLMLSVLRSLESDVRAYDSEEGRKELSAALLSNILDLAESVRDLCAMFPRSREIEAEAVSLGLPMERMPEIRSAIDTVIEKVNASDGATEGGREAINASAADLAHQRGLADEAKQSAYFLVDFANFTRAGLKHLKTTGAVFGGELGGLGADSWRAFRRGAPKGIERGAAEAGKALIVGGVAALMHVLGSNIAALGSIVGAYAPLHEIFERMSGPPETPTPTAAPVDAEAEAPREPARRKPRRSPAKPPARKRTRP